MRRDVGGRIDAREVDAEGAVLAAREVLADLVDRGPAARHVGRHDPVVGQAEVDAQERHREHEQDRADADAGRATGGA